MKPPAVPTLVAFVLIATFALLNPVHDTDLFWQAHFGELAIAQKGPVRAEPIYPDALGRPIVPIYGLAQVWYAHARRLGGWELVKLLDALVWAAAFVFPASFAQKRYDPTRNWPGAVAAVLACLIASKFYMTRPQTFAMLGFGTLLAIVLSDRSTWQKLRAGLVLGVLWQNAHPSVVVGLLAVAIHAAVGWAIFWRSKSNKPWATTLLMPVLAATMFLTPAGFDVFAVMRDNAERVKQFGVTEWLPLFHPANRGVNVPAVFGLVATGIAMTVRGRRIDPRDATVAIAFAALTVWSHRFVVFFAVGAVPVWVSVLTTRNQSTGHVRRGSWIAMLVFLTLIPTAYYLLGRQVFPLWNDWLPHRAVEALRQSRHVGRVFTETQWGGYLLVEGRSQWQPTHDGRYFARTREECDWYLRAMRGEIAGREIEERLLIDAMFLSPDSKGLLARLRQDGWSVIYRDEYAVVVVHILE